MSTSRKCDAFVIAAWAAVVFGLLEGVVLCLSRAYPAIEAAHKVSPSILWVAPLVDLPMFLLAAVIYLVALVVARRWFASANLLTAYGFFVFVGAYTVISAPRTIQQVGAVMLSLGFAVALCRRLRGSEDRLTVYLRRRLGWLPVLVLATGLGVFGFGHLSEAWQAHSLPAAPAGAKNVLIIVLDTVRADRFEPPRESSLTPNLDRIAVQGVSFNNAWSTTSWSLPSQVSILTGRYPHEHGADWPGLRLNKKYPTLAEFFAARGYVTGAFSGNAAWVTPEYLGRGFLRFQVYELEDLARRTVHGRKIDLLLDEIGYNSAGRGKKAPKVTAEFLRFLDKYRGRPFFAYLCYMDVNQGFHDRMFNHGDPKQVPVQEVVEAYDRSLHVLDTQIGELFSELDRRGLLRQTVVVITSDHGESFGVKNPGDHDPFGHGTSLYREQSAVPLFVIDWRKVPAGEHVAASLSIRQIPATITDLLGIADSPFPGESLSLAWQRKGTSREANASLLAELRDLNSRLIGQSVINGQWQYLYHPEWKEIKKGEELYDFVADPLEKTNRATAADSQPVLAQMRGELQNLLSFGSDLRLELFRSQQSCAHCKVQKALPRVVMSARK